MAEDYLKKYTVDQVAAWYLRLAAAWDGGMTDLHPPLAGAFLRAWVNNRVKDAKIEFEAPAHLRGQSSVLLVQAYHREVFLTTKKARFSGGTEKWAGLLPRIQGLPGYTKWDLKGELALEYESLCDVAPGVLDILRIQQSGSNADRDIFGSLRGFQLKSKVAVSASPQASGQLLVMFKSWTASGTDRYDWNYSEHLTVVNPDYASKQPDAIRPTDKTLTVYHSNAKRLEDAGRAAPFQVVIKPWVVSNAQLVGPVLINPQRQL
jgi:hypothetical protein